MSSPANAYFRLRRIAGAILTATLSVVFSPVLLRSQVTTDVISVTPTEATANAALIVRVELRQGALIDRMYFIYRPFGQSTYKKLEMDFLGNVATGSVPPKEVTAPYLEYYLVLVERFGRIKTYPLSESPDPLSTPPAKTMQIVVRPEGLEESGVVFLSPEPTEPVAPEDVLISISLLRAGTEIAKAATQVFLDGVNVTSDAVFSGDIIVYNPGNFSVRLGSGEHKMLVRLFSPGGQLQQTASAAFTVAETQRLLGTLPRRLPYGVSLQLESRREQVSDETTWYNRGSLQFSARTEEWRFRSNLFVTSDEQSDRQPQNRYFAGIESSWLKLGYGDEYPTFPSLVLSGKRVRGLHSSLKSSFFNIDLAVGSTLRAIDGTLTKVFSSDSLLVEQQRDPSSPYGKVDSVRWGKYNYGTYARNLFVVRPSLGTGEDFQWGLTLLKSKDDIASIRYGSRPQENAVVGSDLMIRFDNGNIELTGQVALSAFNSDISSGQFTDAYIDTAYGKDAQTIKDVRNAIGSYITVNDNLRPLSFAAFSTLAYEIGTALSYLNNNLKFTYLSRGPDYNSFGQTFLRKDIRGFNMNDRVRLVNNQVYLILGYERLQDNVSNTKVATTTFSNFNFAVSYYPRFNFPTLTVGYVYYGNRNDLSPAGQDQLSVINDATNRVFVLGTYNFFLGARHTASVNASTSSRDDQSIWHNTVLNNTLVLSLTSRYKIPLQTTFETSFNNNEFPVANSVPRTRTLKYTVASIAGRYSIQDGRLAFLAGYNPTFGDVKRTVLDFGTEWYALPSMSVILQFNYFHAEGGSHDTIWGLRYRYDL